jgi:hypothetical protein
VLAAIGRFTKVEESLASYPEWQEKVKEEIGKWYHMIHNNYGESESKRKIFNKLVSIVDNSAPAGIFYMIAPPNEWISYFINYTFWVVELPHLL